MEKKVKNIIAPEKLLKTVNLKNGLVLELWDKSRVIAGDRWKIELQARIEIDLEKHISEIKSGLPADFDEVERLLGKSIFFEKTMERFFVDEGQKDPITEDLTNSLIKSLSPYLAHPRFFQRFVLKEYNNARQKESYTKIRQRQ